MGTLINIAGILLGGILGMLFGNLIQDKIRDGLIVSTGAAVLFVGITGTIEKMAVITDGIISMNGSMMLIVTLAIGTLVGEWIDIEHQFERFGEWLKKKSGNESDNQFVNGFVVSSLTVCIGAMAIVGSIQDGISGDYSTLAMKAILDFIIILVMSASFGNGCIFSAIPVGILQGTVTLLARLISGFLTADAITNLSIVGSVLIFCVGVNLIRPKTFRVANMLPAIVFAVLWSVLHISL